VTDVKNEHGLAFGTVVDPVNARLAPKEDSSDQMFRMPEIFYNLATVLGRY
jgi:hypothetical protein